MKLPKFLYHVFTWGGFYNQEHQHGHREGDHWFDTEQDRTDYLLMLHGLEAKLNARHLCGSEHEGYHLSEPVVLHRVTEWEGQRYYTTNRLGYGFSFSGARYIMQHKWYPGCNDYPLGEEFDDYGKVTIVQEWITGSFDLDKEESF